MLLFKIVGSEFKELKAAASLPKPPAAGWFYTPVSLESVHVSKSSGHPFFNQPVLLSPR